MTFYEPKTLTEFNELLVSNKVCIVDFFANWCGPCKQLSAKLHDTLKASPVSDLAVVKLNCDNEDFAELAGKMGVSGIPHVVFYKNGQHVSGKENVVTGFSQSGGGTGTDTVSKILGIAKKLLTG